MIDPLASPWTVRLTRKRGRRRLGRKPSFVGALAARARKATSAGSPRVMVALRARTGAAAMVGLDLGGKLDLDDTPGPGPDSAQPSSYLNARPPHLTRGPLARRPRLRLPTMGRGLRHRLAKATLVLLVAIGLALIGLIVRLVSVGLSWSSGEAAAASPLAVPAPALAGGLVRRYLPVQSATQNELIAEFIRRFTVAAGSYTGHPAAFYREPGTVDLSGNGPGWVMYLGHNSAASLGAPGVTIGRVADALTGTSAPGALWRVAPGPRGGSARCGLTHFGGTNVTLCAWATEYTIGALMSPTSDTSGNELANLMPLMRLDLQPGWASSHIRPSLP